MSILSPQPLAAVAETMRISWLLVILCAVSLAVAIGTRALSFARIPGPARIPPDHSAWPLAGVLLGATGFYVLGVSAAFAIWDAIATKYGAATQPTESAAGIALINTVPSLVVLFALLVGDRFVFPAVHQDLGLSADRLPRGIAYGVGGALLILPPLYLASQLMELVYRSLHYQHPNEHPLLHVLGEAPSRWITATIILGACILAPIFEELLFRAHLQTLLLRSFQFLADLAHSLTTGTRESPTNVSPQIASPDIPNPEISNREILNLKSSLPSTAFSEQLITPVPQPQIESRRSKIPAILSILLTSLLFASVHPTWSFPIIFLLALGLGYAYERTGNLWVSITMHAMFNTVSTLLFLAGGSQ